MKTNTPHCRNNSNIQYNTVIVEIEAESIPLRDRPFNLKGGYGFLFHSEFFFRTTREL
jgi:hypothetical protein